MAKISKNLTGLILQISSEKPVLWGKIEAELNVMAAKNIADAISSPNNTVFQNMELAWYDALTSLASLRQKELDKK